VLDIVREPSIWSFIASPPSLKRPLQPDRAGVLAGGSSGGAGRLLGTPGPCWLCATGSSVERNASKRCDVSTTRRLAHSSTWRAVVSYQKSCYVHTFLEVMVAPPPDPAPVLERAVFSIPIVITFNPCYVSSEGLLYGGLLLQRLHLTDQPEWAE
jgi:hypothetical protein